MNRRLTRSCSLLLAVLLIGGLGHWVPTTQATSPEPIRYGYDASGRLTGVVDPAVGAAKYAYDAAGNITSIARPAATTPTVIGFTPVAGASGTTVVINGSAFGPAISDNTVTFNGTTATITAASPTQLTAIVPVGTTSGPLAITAPGGSVTTDASFRLSSAPVVTSFTPNIAAAGATVSVAGSGFMPGATVVGVGEQARSPQSVTSTSLSFVVPIGGSGQIGVATPDGSTTTAQDLFVPPPPYVATDVAFAAHATLGVPQVVTVGASGKIALLTFTGTSGQRWTRSNWLWQPVSPPLPEPPVPMASGRE